MSSEIKERDLAEAYLGGLLTSLGLGVHYSRAEKDTLFYRNSAGREIPVLDLVGGYGSTILGHHQPEIVAYAKELLDQGVPVHAQFSSHPYADDLARTLNAVLQRESGTRETYSALFANSGAEAVEIAMKHAEFDRVAKVAALAAEIGENVARARTAVATDAGLVTGGAAGLEELITEITALNSGRTATAPVFLAPEGSFHGKLVGSVQLTHNPGFRAPFSALAAQCRFVPVHEPEALAKTIESERTTLLDLAIGDGTIRVVERPLPVVAAFILEPIQGEAGIRVFDRETALRIQQACEAADVPIIVDEVQSGMGRTGAFFASSHVGLRGDYYTLAKSLGGGIAKTAMTLIRTSRYRAEFELVHSSTFAKDAFSTLIASRTVDLLEASGGELYRRAAERGDRILAVLRKLQQEFPNVVADVRGAGLMIGLELTDQSDSASAAVAEQARAGLLGYFLSGYLLRAHAVRILPTASATSTLRLEPSVYITDAEVERLETALRALLTAVRDPNDAVLFAPAAG